MKKMSFPVAGALMLLFAAIPPVAQEQGPAKVLQITREEVKPGRAPAHAKIEAGWPRAYDKHNWPVGYIAMTSIAGANEAWYMTGHPSFAAMEQNEQATAKNAALTAELEALSGRDAEVLSNIRTILASYRPEFSHNPRGNLAQMRYVQVFTHRVRIGRERDWAEATRIYKETISKADPQAHWAAYEVVSGMPVPTYLIFVAHESLSELEPGPDADRKFGEALGANAAAFQKAVTDSIVTLDSQAFAISPSQSYVTKDFAGADSEFWHPKPKAAPAKQPAKAPN